MLRGGYAVLEQVRQRCGVPPKTPTADGVFSYEEVECLGACTGAPPRPEPGFFPRRFGLPDSTSLDTYLKHDGYQALDKALKQMTPEQIIQEVKRSNLRGRGAAGLPAGMKWSFVPKDSPKPKYIIANADESEPGTCKDRPLMELDPHQLIEGMIIAGRAVNAHQGFIYI